MNVRTAAAAGFTLIEIMVVVAIIGLLASISTPRFLKARETSQFSAIINNLRLIESAKELWALESRQGGGTLPVETNIVSFLRGNAMPKPVVGETYNINAVGTPPDATIPVALGTVPAGGTVTLP
jgi:prepilin-type N-terminal cleavage/methylation domain-containing protein